MKSRNAIVVNLDRMMDKAKQDPYLAALPPATVRLLFIFGIGTALYSQDGYATEHFRVAMLHTEWLVNYELGAAGLAMPARLDAVNAADAILIGEMDRLIAERESKSPAAMTPEAAAKVES